MTYHGYILIAAYWNVYGWDCYVGPYTSLLDLRRNLSSISKAGFRILVEDAQKTGLGEYYAPHYLDQPKFILLHKPWLAELYQTPASLAPDEIKLDQMTKMLVKALELAREWRDG